MAQHHPTPAPPSHPAWDIAFTRQAHAAQPRIDNCVLDLTRRIGALGLRTDTQVRHTPRGLSTFVAVVGQRGLVCIVDITLIDGMLVDQGPCAALDIRLLDACGDVVAEGLAHGPPGAPGRSTLTGLPAQALTPEALARAATAVYVSVLAYFGG